MDNKIKESVKIQIDKLSLICYILENNQRYISEGIKTYFRGTPDIPLHILSDERNDELKGYYLEDIVKHLNPKTLKLLTTLSLNRLIDNSIKNPPKEKELSDFDRLMKKALDYNPKNKEK